MTAKNYGVYFDRWDLRVDEEGILQNPDALRIIEFECDEDTGDVLAVRRVDEKGNVLETDPDLRDLDHAGEDDSLTIDQAIGWVDKWLDENTEWRESRRETRYQPAEYVCIGITGCIGDPWSEW